jgi:aryl-alcohol dehydrogenase-like predicted oxidoreductase
MEYRPLGRTGVKVSALCVGCWMFGDRASPEESRAIIQAAIESGVNFFDTANIYGGGLGKSETIVGDAIAASGKRDKLVIATKVFWPADPDDPNGRGVSRRHIIEQVEGSLRRLKTDHIDLYYMHRLDPEVPVDEPLRALDDLIRSGKVRYIGTSTTAAWQFVESLWVSKELGLNRFIAETPPYNIADRRIEKELIPMAQTFGVAVNPWAPVAGGLLTGIYQRNQPAAEGTRYADPRIATVYARRMSPGLFDLLDVLNPMAQEKGVTMAQLALGWVLRQPGVTSPVIGPEKLSDFTDALGALDVEITGEDRAKIDAAAPPTGMLSPFYEPDANQFRAHPHRVF